MTGRRRGVLVPLLLLLWLVPVRGWATPEQDMQEGARAYDRGDFKQAIALIRPLLYPAIRLTSQQQVLRAHRLLGVSYVLEKKRTEATKEFLAILAIRPSFSMDPLVDPAAAVQLFEEVKKRNADKIRAILERERREAEKRRREEQRRRDEERRLRLLAQQGQQVVELRVEQHPYWINFLPLGAGQFQNGHRRKGWLLFGTQLSLAALSAGSYLGGYLAYSGEPLNKEEYDRARRLSIVQVVSAGLCAATVAYGIIDALAYYQPQTVTERRYKRKPKQGGQTSAASYFVIPTIGADGRSGGLGLGLTF